LPVTRTTWRGPQHGGATSQGVSGDERMPFALGGGGGGETGEAGHSGQAGDEQ